MYLVLLNVKKEVKDQFIALLKWTCLSAFNGMLYMTQL